jgi:2-keto-4-pentenoate hydratase
VSDPSDDPRIVGGMRAQLARRRARLDAGDAALGWKVGFGAPAAMAMLKITAPIVGHLMRSGRVESGATVSLAGWVKPVAEPEIALHIGADLAAGADRAAAKAAIAAIGPAIELADLDLPPEDVSAILTGNIYQRHVVLGPPDPWRAAPRLDGLTGHIRRNDSEVAEATDLQVNTGDVVDLLRLVANMLAPFGERVRAGEVVICGSVVPPLFLEAGDESAGFELAPLGSVAVRFQR